MRVIIGISGSLRKESYNTALLRAAAELAPAGVTIELASIADIPLYDGDAENTSGVPAPVTVLKDRIAAAAGLLVATPEYNNSVPGLLKNAIDWLTRPPKDIPRVFADKPVAMIGATPGGGGTRFAQAALLPIWRTLGTRIYTGTPIYVAKAGEVFDAQGKMVDERIKKHLSGFVAGFVKMIG